MLFIKEIGSSVDAATFAKQAVGRWTLLLWVAEYQIYRCKYSSAQELLYEIKELLVASDLPKSDQRWGKQQLLQLELSKEISDISSVKRHTDALRVNLVRYDWPIILCDFLAIDAHSLFNEGKLNEALKLFKRGHKMALERKVYTVVHKNLRGLSLTQLRMGLLDEAEKSLQLLWHSCTQHEDNYSKALYYLYHGIFMLQKNDLELTENRIVLAIQMFQKNDLHKLAAEGMNLLGDIHRSRENHEKAKDQYTKSLQLMTQINHPDKDIPLLNIAIIMSANNQHRERETISP